MDSILSTFGLNGPSLEWIGLEKVFFYFLFYFFERLGLDGTYPLKKATFILENLVQGLYCTNFFLFYLFFFFFFNV